MFFKDYLCMIIQYMLMVFEKKWEDERDISIRMRPQKERLLWDLNL